MSNRAWRQLKEECEAQLSSEQLQQVAEVRAQRWLGRLGPQYKQKKDHWEDVPRDEGGKWTESGSDGGDGGGGAAPAGAPAGSKHPGEGYSKDSYEKDGVIYTDNVYDAQRALFENRKVELDQVATVSTLIDKLGETSKNMIAEGKKAPLFDLCNVTVAGTNLFCADTKNIPRIEMPQVAKEETKPFVSYLKDHGYKVEKTKEKAANLRATQNQLDGAKVAGIVSEKLRPNPDKKLKWLVISKDNYILDGHHHWAAKIGMDAADGNLKNDMKMRVMRVNIKITKLLEEADKYTGGKGKKPAGERATTPEIFDVKWLTRVWDDMDVDVAELSFDEEEDDDNDDGDAQIKARAEAASFFDGILWEPRKS